MGNLAALTVTDLLLSIMKFKYITNKINYHNESKLSHVWRYIGNIFCISCDKDTFRYHATHIHWRTKVFIPQKCSQYDVLEAA